MVDQTIKIADKIEAIVKDNMKEKRKEHTEFIECCEDCRYFDEFWVWGGELYCCSSDYDDVSVSRSKKALYKKCPIDHKTTYNKGFIKQYGIIHEKPRNKWDCGAIKVVDFSKTHFEADGHNPTVRYEHIVIFFYRNEEEKEQMMELALDYYNKFNLDAEWVEKRCYD